MKKQTLTLAVALLGQASGQVVINEIFYHSPADLDNLEFVELYNAGSQAVDLSGWEFSKGIDYQFPKATSIAGGGYLVLCRDAGLFKKLYDKEANGVYAKSLNNGGETLTLRNAKGKKVDSVKYDDTAPWPKSADGYSASLERLCPTAAGNDPANWTASSLSEDYSTKPSGTPGAQNSVFAKALGPVIRSVNLDTKVIQPNETLTVEAQLDSAAAKVNLLYRIASPGTESEEQTVNMERGEDGRYVATIPGQQANRIIRLRVQATGENGATRTFPHPNEIRPALSVYVDGSFSPNKIPVAHFFNVGESEHQLGAAYRSNHARSRGRGFDRGRREFTEEDRLRRDARERLSDDPLQKVWAKLTLSTEMPAERVATLAEPFRKAQKTLAALEDEAESAKDIRGFVKRLDRELTTLRSSLEQDAADLLSEEQRQLFSAIGNEERGERRGRRFGNPSEILPRIFNVEESWFRTAMLEELSGESLGKLREIHRGGLAERTAFGEKLTNNGDFDFRAVFDDVRDLNDDMGEELAKILNRDQLESIGRGERGPFGRGFGGPSRGRGAEPNRPLPPQGRSAFIFTDPETKRPQLFDFVNITERKSGYKVRLHKDKPLRGMTTLNVLYEPNEGTTINEAFAYELYRLAGNATAKAGFTRVLIDGEVAGFHLWFEQPNGAFFRRNAIDDDGNLYKLIWMGSHRPTKYTPEDKIPERMDIVGKHEKKTHPHDGYDDIVSLIEALEEAQGDDAKTWQLIQEHFEVDQVINYFAVNSLLSHWDGFFNNYFLYHDVKGTGKWSMYPWDQDSTWSLRMGNVDELSTMPINYGAEGARPPGAPPRRDDDARDRDRRGRGGFRGFGGGRGGPGWWRDGGDISRPLLANPDFYKRFQARLKTLAENVFNEETFEPKIEALGTDLESEVRLRAETLGRDADDAVNGLREIMDQLREHLAKRRAFVLRELQ